MASLLAPPVEFTVAGYEAPVLGEVPCQWGAGGLPRPQSPENMGEKEKSSNRAK